MWTVTAVADRDGVSKQAVSARARRFADEHGLTVERDGRGRLTRFNVVQYDSLRARFGDAAKAQAPRPAAPRAEQKPAAGDSREEAQRQQAWIDAERSRLALEEAKGDLVRRAAVLDALAQAAERAAGAIDRLPNAADDLAAAVGRDGSHGLRVLLGALAHQMRKEIAETLRTALSGEPVLAPAAATGEVAATEPVLL